MFPKKQRLARAAFPTALRSGRRLSSRNFTAVVPPEGTGYAVVVSKKTAPGSVARHRLKRRTLSALRAVEKPPALVVFPRASALKMRGKDLREELETLTARVPRHGTRP